MTPFECAVWRRALLWWADGGLPLGKLLELAHELEERVRQRGEWEW